MSEGDLPSEKDTVDILSRRIRKLVGSRPMLAGEKGDEAVAERKKEAGVLRNILKNIGKGNQPSGS